jgi:hypothetical protein
MWTKMVRFQMDDEVERVLREEREQDEAEQRTKKQDGSAQAASPSEVVN